MVSDDVFTPALVFVAAGFIGGLALFARGLMAYRHDRLISSVATSSLDSIAAGEVRISGVVEPIGQTLISPLQSRPCVWYRARVETTGENSRVLMNEEQSQEFQVRDRTGEIRVVPRGARWEIGTVFDESTSFTGDEPPGLRRRTGAAWAIWTEQDPEQMTEVEREAAAQALLTVQQPSGGAVGDDWGTTSLGRLGVAVGTEGGRRYREARVEPGEAVTILAQAWPWGDVRETVLGAQPSDNVEADIAGDIAAAREMGLLAASPEEAWGNAAIPGFGIGQPTTTPELDPRAIQPAVPDDPGIHNAALERHRIPEEELVLSRGLRGGMAIYLGPPAAATRHHDLAFLAGIAGAVMAVVCALGLGALVAGTL